MRVAAVVPAYNEEQRIGAVLEVLRGTPIVQEIVVVDDGSTDGTGEAARGASDGVDAVTLGRNVGKGGAMRAGVLRTNADVILFLDADLVGLTSAHVSALVEPVLLGQADMAVGMFRGGRYITDLSQLLVPYISGQRAVRREVFLAVPALETARFAVETKLTKYAKAHGLTVRTVPLVGVTHVMKEEKRGVLRGVIGRARMYHDIAWSLLRDGRP
jgi:glycosyltransferase involved in cell wall biosynthesis